VLDVIAAIAIASGGRCYSTRIDNAEVGWACVSLATQGKERTLRYQSEAMVRHGPVIVRLSTDATATLDADLSVAKLVGERREGSTVVGRLNDVFRSAIPSALAPALLNLGRDCVPVVEETTGRTGKACGARDGSLLRGDLFGEKFKAVLDDSAFPVSLSFPEQNAEFVTASGQPVLASPPELFAEPMLLSRSDASDPDSIFVPLNSLPAYSGESIQPAAGGTQVTWSPHVPSTDVRRAPPQEGGDWLGAEASRIVGNAGTWQAAAALSRAVAAQITDPRPSTNEADAAEVYRSQRSSCRGHVTLFLALANRVGIDAREVVGLVSFNEHLYPHRWAEVRVGPDWFPVDPTEGSAPPIAPRVALGSGNEAGALLLKLRSHLARTEP
jgi:hypothetical protein